VAAEIILAAGNRQAVAAKAEVLAAGSPEAERPAALPAAVNRAADNLAGATMGGAQPPTQGIFGAVDQIRIDRAAYADWERAARELDPQEGTSPTDMPVTVRYFFAKADNMTTQRLAQQGVAREMATSTAGGLYRETIPTSGDQPTRPGAAYDRRGARGGARGVAGSGGHVAGHRVLQRYGAGGSMGSDRRQGFAARHRDSTHDCRAAVPGAPEPGRTATSCRRQVS
jgi:hypothetical protein